MATTLLRKRSLLPLLVLLLGLLVVPATAEEGAARKAALHEATEPLRARAWGEAVEALGAFRRDHPDTPEAREAWVLQAQALLEADRARDALEATSTFLTVHGEAAWAGRMQHIAARAHEALGRPQDAAGALRERVEATTSPAARADIARLHLALADEDFEGREVEDDLGRTKTVNDYARALGAYRQALAVGLPDEEARHARERIARSLEKLGHHQQAAAVWDALLEEAEREEKRGPETREIPWARWWTGRGRARLHAGQRDEARADLRRALERASDDALEMEILLLLAEERFAAAQGPGGDVAFEEGVSWLRRAVAEHRGDERAAEAQWRLAEAYAGRGKAGEAAAEFAAYVERFPDADKVPEARDRRAQQLVQAGRFDEAIATWERFLAAHPNHPLWQQVRQKIAEAAYRKGHALAEEDKPEEAIAAWRAFAERHPEDGRAPAALVAAGRLLHEQESHEAAIELWRQVAGRYQQTPQAPEALLLVATTLEEELGRLEEAVKAYEEIIAKHGGAGQAQEARLRLERLKSKHLELQMERVVATDAAPTLKVVTRNIPKLDVRIYKLEIEAYFRRKGTVEGVENLQLEVVKPDATASWEVEDYARFQLVEADRPLPVEEPGAYVVVAADEDLTSTVLFLVSDAEAVVKSSRGRQLFVWAFARADQTPLEGARVLVAEGDRVREVGTTGPDGVWQGEHGSQAGHVLVMSDRGPAATGLEQGPHSASGFQSKAYVYTDRPVYRPGHEVQWRAIFLRARGGAYLPPAKTSGQLSIVDPRGQTVRETEVASSDFGSFAGTFPVDGAAPLGAWSLRLTIPRLGTWTGTFEVQEFRKPELTVAVEPVEPVYLTGETVKVVGHVRYAFGGVVDDAPVRYEVWRRPRTYEPTRTESYRWYVGGAESEDDDVDRPDDGATLVARGEQRTDDAGDVHLEFETKERDEDSEYIVQIAVQDVTRRWIADRGRIPVTRADHMAVVKADKEVYKPEETVRVEVRTVDALERPVSRAGTLLLLEVKRLLAPVEPGPTPRRRDIRPVPIREQEIERAAYPLTTGDDGSAALELRLPHAGRWRLRWRAEDARGTLVTAHEDVEAAGEAEDPSRDARLVASRPVVVEGESAEVLLRSPVTGVLALVTHEAESVLEHRFVRLTGTSTLLSLPVRAEHAPNVFFQVAIPGDGRLLEAEAEVVVLRHLDVAVALPADARPGETVEVEVTTRDAKGRPVPAEVSVALVDETIFSVAADQAGAIRPYFYDRRRAHDVRTATSLGFRTYGTTRETNKDLLAEEALRGGDAQRVAAQSALNNAREALRRGDVQTAAQLALRAAEMDPQSWGARSFLLELGSREDARKALSALGRRGLEDALVAEELERMDRAAPQRAPGSPAPRPSAEPMTDAEAPMDSPAEAGAIGIGGGAGGAFGGRSGRRRLEARGGGARSGDDADDARGFVAGAELISLRQQVGQMQDKLAEAEKGAAGFGLDAGFTLEVRRTFADTATFAPHVVTGEDGRATVEVELPDNLTTWRATVRGVSRRALVGEARGRMVATKPLLVRVDTPRFLTDGDELTVPVAVHNETGQSQDVVVALEAEGVTLGGEDETVAIGDGMRAVSDREVETAGPGRVRFEATARAPTGGDRVEVVLGTLPRGIKEIEGRTGHIDTRRGARGETAFDVPEGVVPGATKLAVALHPGIDSALLDALLYLRVYPYGCVEQTVHRFLPAIEARAALRAIGSPAAAQLDELDDAIGRGAMRLRNLQNQDGSFGWFRGGQGDLAMTAYALRGLAAARESGVGELDLVIQRATDALERMVGAGDEDVRALAHLALATVGRTSDAYAITFRRRNDDLSTAGLAWMALAADRLGRSYDESELVRLLLERRVEEGRETHWTGAKDDCFVGSDREATGLAVQALLAADEVPQAERGLRWLLAQSGGEGFGTTKETAAFVGAASAWVARGGATQFGGAVDVLLDGTVVRTIETGAGALPAEDRRFLLEEAEDWSAGRHTLAFRLRGEGDLHWAARLEVVVASDELEGEIHGLGVERRFLEPVVQAVEGEEGPVKPGYSILRPAARPKVEAQPLEAVAAGDHVLVRIELDAPRDLDYVLVEDPLPAGFEVLEGTAKGPFEWQERRDDRQVFFLTRVPKGPHVIEYVIQATHWGRFTALGTTAYPMYLPQVHGRAAGATMRVVPASAAGEDVETPPTPDERYGRARRLFERGALGEAVSILRALQEELPLRDEVIEEIETYRLRAAVEQDDPQEIVRAREALLRRNPQRIPGDWKTQRAIAFAYHALEAWESASTLFRDLVVRGFGLHGDWMRTLAARGEEVRGLDHLGEALARFPLTNATAQAAFERAQRYRELPRPEGRDRPAGQPMDEESLEALRSFTAHYAGTPWAAPANYAIIEALRRAGRVEEAAAAAEDFLARYEGSIYEDDAWYFLAETRYKAFEAEPTAEHAAPVREAARAIVDGRFRRRDGRTVESEFQPQAWYLLARVHHVLGELDQAIQAYWHARTIEDAREARAFLTEERLTLEQTVSVPLTGPATIPMTYRNVGEVAFKAYPVDLQTLFTVRKSLEGLHQIDLSGLVPTHQWTQKLPDASDHRGHRAEVALPVEEGAPGAWLVLAKAGDHEAQSLVIRTDLKLVIQRVGEKVRAYVTDADGEPVRGAAVTVADGQRIRARGFTDGRGLFEAPGAGPGAAVVVAQGDRYAIGR